MKSPMLNVYAAAAKYEGLWEWKDGHNPKIVKWFADVGHEWVKDDETAWCAAFAGAMLKEVGLPHTGKLNARSYLDWGEPVDIEDAQRGDVVIFSRDDPSGWQGHVAFLDRVGESVVFVLGGNQSNQVNVKAYGRKQLLGIRRMTPPADVIQPAPWWAGIVTAIRGMFRRKK